MTRSILPFILVLVGCSQATAERDEPVREDVGESGVLEFELDLAGAVPAGKVSAELTILRDDVPLEGVNVWITARMPGHTHTESAARADDLGEGIYEINDLELMMPGEWTLELDAEAEGAHDTVTFEILVE
ncbi:MAG: FixH family protein [Myxococcales bacterium]|nr:FixH family protein [Myxococcales bacterium]